MTKAEAGRLGGRRRAKTTTRAQRAAWGRLGGKAKHAETQRQRERDLLDTLAAKVVIQRRIIWSAN